MTWVGLRLQRTEGLIALAVLGLIAALLIPTGISMANAFHHDGLSACLGTNPSYACNNALNDFQSKFQSLFTLTGWLTLIPGLIGVLLAAPFILELETGTYRLAWTQSITRRRWIAVKLTVPIVSALLIGGALILLMTWWRSPFVQLNGRLDTGTYDSEGTVILGYVLFALALALAVGVILRRAVVAIIVAFIGYFIARIFVDAWLRQRLVTPLSATWKASQAQPADLNHAWVLKMTGSGPGIVRTGGGGLFGGAHAQAAASKLVGKITMHAVYQPPSHFWPLQLTETGLFAGVALVLIAFAAWWTHERVA
jgi:phosphotransferase system  glucose/maltose/N-acetylglucosamine-specific IIC component